MVDCSRLHSFLASMLIGNVLWAVGPSSFYQLQYGRLWNRNVFSVSSFPLEKLGKACCFLGYLFAVGRGSFFYCIAFSVAMLSWTICKPRSTMSVSLFPNISLRSSPWRQHWSNLWCNFVKQWLLFELWRAYTFCFSVLYVLFLYCFDLVYMAMIGEMNRIYCLLDAFGVYWFKTTRKSCFFVSEFISYWSAVAGHGDLTWSPLYDEILMRFYMFICSWLLVSCYAFTFHETDKWNILRFLYTSENDNDKVSTRPLLFGIGFVVNFLQWALFEFNTISAI